MAVGVIIRTVINNMTFGARAIQPCCRSKIRRKFGLLDRGRAVWRSSAL
jgi:hypothetical protein